MTIEEALRRYATLEPLDLIRPHELQHDLLAIAGDQHAFVAPPGGGEQCGLCGRNLRNEVHIRS